MLIIILAVSCFALLLFAFYSFLRFKIIKNNLDFCSLELEKEQRIRQGLEQEKINFIRDIEKYKTYIEHLKQEDSRVQNMLIELGNNLSKELIEAHKRENKEGREISEQTLNQATTKFNSEFERLSNMIAVLSKDIEHSKNNVDTIKKSLLSPSSCGRLAEITLENILKSSGLKSGIDYIIQYNITSESNNRLRPDAVVFLPGGNIMIIDAKASQFLMSRENDNKDTAKQGAEASALAKTMNQHLKSLNSKDYKENIQEKIENYNNIIVLMFLPTEQAIDIVLEADNEFINKAWALNIIPVGPMGLMNMLSFAKFQISDYARFENQKAILEEVKNLLLSISTLSEYSRKLSNNIEQLVSNYDKFAASFNRNFVTKAKNIENLGIDLGSKSINPLPLERHHLILSKKNNLKDEQA